MGNLQQVMKYLILFTIIASSLATKYDDEIAEKVRSYIENSGLDQELERLNSYNVDEVVENVSHQLDAKWDEYTDAKKMQHVQDLVMNEVLGSLDNVYPDWKDLTDHDKLAALMSEFKENSTKKLSKLLKRTYRKNGRGFFTEAQKKYRNFKAQYEQFKAEFQDQAIDFIQPWLNQLKNMATEIMNDDEVAEVKN